MQYSRHRTLSVTFIALLLVGCSKQPENTTFIPPEAIAQQFAKALLIDNNADELKALITPALSSQLDMYITPSQYARSVLNMTMSPPITIQTHNVRIEGDLVKGGISEARVALSLQGQRHGSDHIDIRLVHLHKIDDNWRVSEISTPKVNPNERFGIETQ